MIEFIKTTEEDMPLIQRWISLDPWHARPDYKDDAAWWASLWYYSPQANATFKLVDDEGIVLFVRLDQDRDTLLRLHTQFGPVEEVSEKRVAQAIMYGIKTFIPHGVQNGATGIITESMSPKLIAFLIKRLNFKQDTGNDYLLTFEGNN